METVELPEYYSTKELQAMGTEELRMAQANGFRKMGPSPLPPPPQALAPRPAAEVWGSNEFDFVCPSGAQCRMRKLMPERMVEKGILDKVTTLPGIVAEVVEKAEGAPPKPKEDMPTSQELSAVLEVMEILIPLVVVTPEVFPVPTTDDPNGTPEPRVLGRIYTDSIEIQDRIAIMERAMQGVKVFEPFRAGSSQPV